MTCYKLPNSNKSYKFWSAYLKQMKVRDLGNHSMFFGVEVVHAWEKGVIALSQRAFIHQMALRLQFSATERPISPIKVVFN